MNITETLLRRNKDLIESNRQLLLVLEKHIKRAEQLSQEAIERERYIGYLETIIHELGWNPNHE